MLVQSWCFAPKGSIHQQHTRKAVAFGCKNSRPRPPVSGYFQPSVHTKTAISGTKNTGPQKAVPRVDFWKRRLLVYVLTEENGGFLIQWCHALYASSTRLPCKGCYRISITSAFLCGRAQKIQIRYVWTRISDTSQQDLIAFNLQNNKKKFSEQMRRLTHRLQINPP